jgi:3',5'-cyclic AMP phosphodiesterase CpdA
MRILHLSDTHLTASGFDEDGVDAVASLDRILHDVRFVPDLDLVVVSGDLADDGSVAGYAAVHERIGRFAAERQIPQIYCIGNHDNRAAFGQVLGTGHVDAAGREVGQTAVPDARAAVSDVSGLRVITLDSLVPGSAHGLVSDAQLAWLGSVLAEPAQAGSVVVVHHPPIALSAVPWMVTDGLRNAEALGDVLAATDVRAVLCGHFHLQLAGALRGIPVSVTPGVVTRLDLTTRPHLWRGVKGASATVVELGTSGGPLFQAMQARDPHAGEPVYLVDTRSGTDATED